MAYIKSAFEKNYVMDPHTATCFKSCQSDEFRDRINLIYSTAEWTKFAVVIDQAISGNRPQTDQEALRHIAELSGQSIPSMIANLFDKPVMHPEVVAKQDIEATILAFLEAKS